MARATQKQRVLEALRAHPDGLSVQYIKRTMMISEANARVSNLRADGYDIQKVDTDVYGFAILKLMSEPKKKITTYTHEIRNGEVFAVPKTTWV